MTRRSDPLGPHMTRIATAPASSQEKNTDPNETEYVSHVRSYGSSILSPAARGTKMARA